MTKRLEIRDNKGYRPLRHAVGEIIRRISATLPDLKEPIKMYLAGGMAVNFYTGYRPTVDVDASFSHRVLLPKAEDLAVSYESEEGKLRMVCFDMNHDTSFALLHPDYDKDAYHVNGAEFDDRKIDLCILSPIDLAVSKIARFENNDREDIPELARHQLIHDKTLEERATQALDCYIGNQSMLLINLKQAVQIVRDRQRDLTR
ncbi:MAG: DUF6036 family nucleotidyltransferase [Acidiferrobacteraceae bacterium]